MIAPLRRRHRLMFFALGIVVLPLLALALSDRPSIPSQPLPEGAAGVWSESDRQPIITYHPFGELDAELRIYPERWVLELSSPLRHPDVLAYGSAEPADTDLPAGAHLLGTVSAARPNIFHPPPSGGDAFLILYSLGHQQVVASAPVGPAGGSAGSTADSRGES